MKILFILFSVLVSGSTFAQRTKYTYSASGNRSIRQWDTMNPFRVGNKDSTNSAKEFRDIVMKEGISVYPNPTNGKITLSLNKFEASEKNSVSIIDLKGSELISQPVTQSNTEIDLSSLKSGIYYFKVIKNKQELYYKVVKVD